MSTADEKVALTRLQEIPNVGPAVARRLVALGFDGVDSLRGQDPEELFARTEAARGTPEDPCLLDTYRAVVAFADTGDDRPWHAYSRERLAQEAIVGRASRAGA
ncbi:helix-hairpin-helix domain-containing protein [Conexibacter woesei]|uniref:helix-hairpin-helix domain-containing protein n=1 Tax=Conexibacter woesei TaxID=191495 RepID=UPI0003FE1784|nr:helix-hairpin-helix domain-containing protein [Conexibacter woesei]